MTGDDGDAVLAAIAAHRGVGRVLPDPVPRGLVEELLAAALRPEPPPHRPVEVRRARRRGPALAG